VAQFLAVCSSAKPLPVNLSVMISRYAATCWGNHRCSHCWLSSTTFKMPSALLPIGLQLIPLCFNWLRVLDTAERPQIDQGIGHQLHPIVSLLDAFKS